MAKSPNQKLKLLYLYQILLQRTDEEHPITVPQLIGELDLRGIRAERKSVYDDLEALRLFGLDVQSRKGRSPGWFVGRREFELPELKLLVDVVQSSRFITRKKSDALIRKLEGLASSHQARQLQRQVYVSGRVKASSTRPSRPGRASPSATLTTTCTGTRSFGGRGGVTPSLPTA